MSEIEVRVQRVREGAALPEYATAGAAGVDLHACIEQAVTLAPGERSVIPTGLAIALPDHHWVALVFPRSGLATRHGLVLANSVGVIDADYRGEVLCAMLNQGTEPVTIEPQQRIAQMLFVPIALARLREVDQLPATERGSGGFGSTGV